MLLMDSADFSDVVSEIGNKWGTSVDGVADYHYNLSAHHADFWDMAKSPYINPSIAYGWRTPYYGVYGRGSW